MPSHLWSQNFGSATTDEGFAVAVDASGNVFVTGYFTGTVNFGGSNLISAGSGDIFFAKYDAAGVHQWSKRFGSNFLDHGSAVTVDASGNVIVTGRFAGTVDFGGGNLSSAEGSDDIFFAKYDAGGAHQWSQVFGSTAFDVGTALATDALGNVYLYGIFSETADFGGSPLVSAGSRDIFLAKFDATGVHQWSQRFGSTDLDESGSSVGVDAAGNIVVSGIFRGIVNFGGASLVSAGAGDIFLAKYDAAGIHQWSKRFGNTGDDWGRSVTVGATGNVFAAGSFSNTVDFGGGDIPSAGSFDIFVAAYDSAGVHLWSRGFGGTGHDEARLIAHDALDNVFTTGYFQNTVNLGGSDLLSAGGWDIFLAGYDSTGGHQWSERFGSNSKDWAYGVAADGLGRVAATGIFGGTVDFGGGDLTSAGSSDIFVASYGDSIATIVVYVNAAATGANNGSSWADAYVDLQSALAAAASGDEIWVAAGIYKPTAGIDPTATFQLVSGVAVYGGFAGTETMLVQRDWKTNVTTLSGDIDLQGETWDNSYHVVTGSGTDSTAVLDGFTVFGGSAWGTSDAGGGMINWPGSPTIQNVEFWYNSARHGGGVGNREGSHPIMTNVIFALNTASEGAAVFNDGNSAPLLVNALFWRNSGVLSGAIQPDSCQGAGVYNHNSSPTLVNVTFGANLATSGEAISNYGTSYPTVTNAIIWNVTGVGTNDEIINDPPSSTTISHSIVRGCGGSGAGWNAACGVDGGGNLGVGPKFIGAPVGNLLGLQLANGSPAIDAGDNSAVSGVGTDLAGGPRIRYGTVDVGAYEWLQFQCPPGSRVYVDQNAAGSGDGSSWANAFTELRDALYAVAAGCSTVTEVWVAAGTYTPAVDWWNPEETFFLYDGVATYGGFEGWESMLDQRDWRANETVLSGDIGIDDSYHVVTTSLTDSTAVLDGFTVMGGRAIQFSQFTWAGAEGGGGMYTAYSNATVRNVIFTDNSSTANLATGGAMENSSSNPTLVNVEFRSNSADWFGGAMYNDASDPTLVNVLFSGNSTLGGGGAIYNQFSNPTLVNVTFSGNSAPGVIGVSGGGGMFNFASSPTLYNTIFWGNFSVDGDPEIENTSSSFPFIANSIVRGSGGSGSWDPSFGIDGGSNKDEDARFVDELGGDLHLRDNSPASNAGDSTVVPTGVDTDLDGNQRIQESNVDMGSYEGYAPDSLLYVDGQASGANDGSSWTDAYVDLQSALAAAFPGVEIWVAEGTYKPTSGSDREATFQLSSGVELYGGFAGTETMRDRRNWTANPTILSGDIGTLGLADDNSYHVVTGNGTVSSAVLDGFTVTKANGYQFPPPPDPWYPLGGIVNVAGSPTVRNTTIESNHEGGMANYALMDEYGTILQPSFPTVVNVTFTGNGTGMYNEGSSPTLVDVVFLNNLGSGMRNRKSNLSLTRVVFSGNSVGTDGGGMYNEESDVSLVDAIFFGNTANLSGGGMHNWKSTATLENVVFWGNSAVNAGGGLVSWRLGAPVDSLTLVNVTFSNNTAGISGGAMYGFFVTTTVVNTICWSNSAPAYPEIAYAGPPEIQFYHSLVKGCGGSGSGWVDSLGIDLGGNIDDDPLFADQVGGDLRLTFGSPAIDAGDAAAVTASTDLDGNPRIFPGGTVDMGAYEFQAVAAAAAFPSPLVFTQAPVNQTTCDTVYIVNSGAIPLLIGGIMGCAVAPFSVDTTATAHTVAPGDTTGIVVCVMPTGQGPDSCSVTVVSNAANSPTTIPIRLDVVTAVGSGGTPKPFRIVSVTPNPFNPTTVVHFTLPEAMPVTAEIWSVTGARVRVLADRKPVGPGDNQLTWDGRNDHGAPVASGVYFVRVKTRAGTRVARAVLLK